MGLCRRYRPDAAGQYGLDRSESGNEAADSGQQLADPEGTPPEAVYPKALDDAAAQTVPGSVAQSNLTVILTLGIKKIDQKANCR